MLVQHAVMRMWSFEPSELNGGSACCACCVAWMQLMFDYSPNEDVPWFDGSLAKLYDYFETAPEVWKDAGLFLKVNMGQEGEHEGCSAAPSSCQGSRNLCPHCIRLFTCCLLHALFFSSLKR